ncbi:MAG: hypothetical protein D6755_09430 [Anaerolineae bacterium]|nr:MAG: hypothetical protein D6755_09430 [Anaerolineae bacterium]
MFKKKWLLSLVLVFLLGACGGKATDAPASDEPWTSHTDTTLGISVEYPADWALKSDSEGGGLYISNDVSNFGSPIIVNGVGVIVSAFPISDFNGITDPAKILDIYFSNLQSLSADLTPVGETETLRIHGNPAATARFQGTAFDQQGEFTFTAIVHGDTIASVLTIDTTTSGEHTQRLRRIAESVTFTP